MSPASGMPALHGKESRSARYCAGDVAAKPDQGSAWRWQNPARTLVWIVSQWVSNWTRQLSSFNAESDLPIRSGSKGASVTNPVSLHGPGGTPKDRKVKRMEAATKPGAVGVKIVRRIYGQRLIDRDPKRLLDEFATPDIEYVDPAEAVDPGTRRGRAEVGRALR